MLQDDLQAAARKAVEERLSALDLEVPSTSVEFMRSWKRAKNDAAALYAFLSRCVCLPAACRAHTRRPLRWPPAHGLPIPYGARTCGSEIPAPASPTGPYVAESSEGMGNPLEEALWAMQLLHCALACSTWSLSSSLLPCLFHRDRCHLLP